VSKTIAATEVLVHPGAIRELHVCVPFLRLLPPDILIQWHPTEGEWSFFM
jgi:hypothetical protein